MSKQADSTQIKNWTETRKYVSMHEKYFDGTFPWVYAGEEKDYNATDEEHKKNWPDPYGNPFYTTNDHGLRHSHAITETIPNSIAFLGCSITYGIGMPYEKMWAPMVANELGKTPVIMAQPGGGWDSAFRLYSAWQPIARCSWTIIYLPDFGRREFVSAGGGRSSEEVNPQFYGHWNVKDAVDSGNTELAEFYVDKMFSAPSNWENRYKNITAIQKIANNTSSKLLILSHSDFDRTKSLSINGVYDLARDLAHPGPLWNIEMRNYALNQFRKGKWKN